MIRHKAAGANRAEAVPSEPSQPASAEETGAETLPPQPVERQSGGRAAEQPADVTVPGQTAIVDLGRLAWLVTVLACLITIAILTVQGYYGYALVTLAVAVSAGINLV
jgi:hypothetical protein